MIFSIHACYEKTESNTFVEFIHKHMVQENKVKSLRISQAPCMGSYTAYNVLVNYCKILDILDYLSDLLKIYNIILQK